MSQQRWSNWGDHPLVVTTIVLAGLVTIAGAIYEGGSSFYKRNSEPLPTPTPIIMSSQPVSKKPFPTSATSPTPMPMIQADGSTHMITIDSEHSGGQLSFVSDNDNKVWSNIVVNCYDRCSGIFLGINDVYKGIDNVMPTVNELKEGKTFLLTTAHFRLTATVSRIETGDDTSPQLPYLKIIKTLILRIQVRERTTKK